MKKRKSNFTTVLGFEYISVIKNKGFIISTVVIVALMLLMSFVPLIITSAASSAGEEESGEKEKIALVNNAYESDDNLVSAFQKSFPDYDIELAQSGDTLNTAVENGDYSFAVIVSGPLEYSFITITQSIYDSTDDTVNQAVVSGYKITELEKAGISAESAEELLSASAKGSIVTLGTNQTTAYLSTYILIMALYIAIASYGQMVSVSVVTEKSTRTMEMLITRASPSDLMFGKVIGTGLAGLTQAVLLVAVGTASLSTVLASLPEELRSIFSFPLDDVLFALLFFVLAFFIYAFIFAAAASLASRAEDLSSLTMPITLVVIFAFFVVIYGMNSGEMDGTLMVATSYIPLTAPLSMFARIAMSDVAAWEIILSVAIQLVTIFILGKLTAAIYRVGVLLYGKPPKLGEVLKTVLHS